MVFSVNTDAVQLAAMRVVNNTSRSRDVTMGRMATGLAIETAKDNAAVYTIAQNARSDLASMNSAIGSVDRGKNVLDIASAGAENIIRILTELKEKAAQLKSLQGDSSLVKAVAEDITTQLKVIDSIVNVSDYDGTNLLKGTNGAEVKVIISEDLGSIPMTVRNMNSTALGLASVNFEGNPDTAITALDNAISSALTKAAGFGSESRNLQIQRDFLILRRDTVEEGVGNMVDADMAREHARFEANNVKTALAQQTLGIAGRSRALVGRLFGL